VHAALNLVSAYLSPAPTFFQVAAQINATIHKKDPKPTPTATIG